MNAFKRTFSRSAPVMALLLAFLVIGLPSGETWARGHRHDDRWEKRPRVKVVRPLPHCHAAPRVGPWRVRPYRGALCRRMPSFFFSFRAPRSSVFVSVPYVEFRSPPPPKRIRARWDVSVAVGVLNVRSGPGPRYRVIDRVGRGTVLAVLEQEGSWLCVRLHDGRVGWVLGRYTAGHSPRG
jgi:hypothetical protein